MIITFAAAFATTLNKMRKFIDQWIVADDQETLLVAQRRAALDPAVIAAEVRPDSMFTARPTAAPHLTPPPFSPIPAMGTPLCPSRMLRSDAPTPTATAPSLVMSSTHFSKPSRNWRRRNS